jgi:hypothetical protein
MQLLYWTVTDTQQHHTYCDKTEITALHKTAVCPYAADVQCRLSAIWALCQLTKQDNQTYNLLHTAETHNLQSLEHTQRSIYRAPDNAGLPANITNVTAADKRARFSHVLLHVDRSCSQRACEIFHSIFLQYFFKVTEAVAESFVLKHPPSAASCNRIYRIMANFRPTGSALDKIKCEIYVLSCEERFTLSWNDNSHSKMQSMGPHLLQTTLNTITFDWSRHHPSTCL